MIRQCSGGEVDNNWIRLLLLIAVGVTVQLDDNKDNDSLCLGPVSVYICKVWQLSNNNENNTNNKNTNESDDKCLF